MSTVNALPSAALCAQAEAFGDPSVWDLRRLSLRRPKGNRALVRVAATSVNPIDLAARRGELKAIRRPPIGTGLDVAGHVVAAGPRWPGPRVGQPVWGALGGAPVKARMAAAEYVEVKPGWVVEAPTRIPLTDAAALPVVALTAYLGLRALSLAPGRTILIRGASGGVGTAALQVARHMGLHVTALCSPRNDGLCQELGADETVDYHALDWATLPRFDGALDLAGGPELTQLRRVVRRGGWIAAGIPKRPGFMLASMLPGRASVRPIFALPTRKRLTEIARLIDLGHLKPVIAARFPLEKITDAHDHMENDRAAGKRLIDVTAWHPRSQAMPA